MTGFTTGVLAYKKLAEIAERTSVDVPAELCGAA
jgi:hypothetical protein